MTKSKQSDFCCDCKRSIAFEEAFEHSLMHRRQRDQEIMRKFPEQARAFGINIEAEYADYLHDMIPQCPLCLEVMRYQDKSARNFKL